MEQIRKITSSTLIPIGSLIVIAGSIWFLAQVSYQVRINSADISKIENSVSELPTRNEIFVMQEDIKEIKNFLMNK